MGPSLAESWMATGGRTSWSPVAQIPPLRQDSSRHRARSWRLRGSSAPGLLAGAAHRVIENKRHSRKTGKTQ